MENDPFRPNSYLMYMDIYQDIVYYLGNLEYYWVTFDGDPNPPATHKEVVKMQSVHRFRQLTPLEEAML